MYEEVDALVAQQAELSGLVSSLGDDGLGRPSRCDGWSVADVLLHLAQTNEMAVASLSGNLFDVASALAGDIALGSSVDDWAGAVVDVERGAPLEAVRDRWAVSAQQQEAAFRGCDPRARVTWVAGEMAARTLAATRITETWIHAEDIADGLGETLAPTDRLRLTARLVWRTLPYAFERAGRHLHGSVVFDLAAPDGGDWRFAPDGLEGAVTTITGSALDLCRVAGQRGSAAGTTLTADGPDATEVLALMRTFA